MQKISSQNFILLVTLFNFFSLQGMEILKKRAREKQPFVLKMEDNELFVISDQTGKQSKVLAKLPSADSSAEMPITLEIRSEVFKEVYSSLLYLAQENELNSYEKGKELQNKIRKKNYNLPLLGALFKAGDYLDCPCLQKTSQVIIAERIIEALEAPALERICFGNRLNYPAIIPHPYTSMVKLAALANNIIDEYGRIRAINCVIAFGQELPAELSCKIGKEILTQRGIIKKFRYKKNTRSLMMSFFQRALHIKSCAISYDGKKYAASGETMQIITWDHEKNIYRTEMNAPAPVTPLAISPKDETVAKVSEDTIVFISSSIAELHYEDCVALSYSNNGNFIAAANKTGQLVIWDVATKKQVLKAQLPAEEQIACICFDPHNAHIAVGSEEGSIYIWDFPRGALVQTIPGEIPVSSLSYNQAGTILAYGLGHDSAFLWDVKNKAVIRQFGEGGYQVCFGAGNILALGSNYTSGFISVMNIKKNKILYEFWLNSKIVSLLFSGDKNILIGTAYSGSKVKIDLKKSRLEKKLEYIDIDQAVIIAFADQAKQDGMLFKVCKHTFKDIYDSLSAEIIEEIKESVSTECHCWV